MLSCMLLIKNGLLQQCIQTIQRFIQVFRPDRTTPCRRAISSLTLIPFLPLSSLPKDSNLQPPPSSSSFAGTHGVDGRRFGRHSFPRSHDRDSPSYEVRSETRQAPHSRWCLLALPLSLSFEWFSWLCCFCVGMFCF